MYYFRHCEIVLYCHSLQAVSATNFLLLDRARWDQSALLSLPPSGYCNKFPFVGQSSIGPECFIVTPSKRLLQQISFCWTELDGTRVNKQSSMHQLAVLSTGWAVFFHSMSDGVHHSQFFFTVDHFFFFFGFVLGYFFPGSDLTH
jgi:hypothetical protein